MKFTAIEIVNMDKGSLRVAELKMSRKQVMVKDCFQGSFDKPVLSVEKRELKDFKSTGRVSMNNILLLLPPEACPAILGELSREITMQEIKSGVQDIISERADELGVSPDTDIRWNITGESGESQYSVISALPRDILKAFYGVFDKARIKYIMPQLTGYSLLDFGGQGSYCAINLKDDSFDFLVYDAGVLIWTGSYDTEAQSVVTEVIKAVEVMRYRRIYLTELFIVGEVGEREDTLAGELEAALEIPCRVWAFENEGVGAEFSVLISAARRVLGAE